MNSLLKTLSVEALAQGSIPCYVTNAGVQTLTTEELTEWLSSHSFRSGGATILSEHPDIQVHWIVPRGSWSLDTIQTVFRYIHATLTLTLTPFILQYNRLNGKAIATNIAA